MTMPPTPRVTMSYQNIVSGTDQFPSIRSRKREQEVSREYHPTPL